MSRWIALALALVLMSGCGTYRITYRFPSRQPVAEELSLHRKHSHGIGLIGGGGYFFAFHQMFPALVDYSGEQSVPKLCPHGVYEVKHYHDFGQNTVAALISWLILVNAWHQSHVEWRCVKEPSREPAPAAAPTTEAPGDVSRTSRGDNVQ
jgi:hypothetical protein